MSGTNPGSGRISCGASRACVLTLQRHPRLFPVAIDEFRRALIRRFPFEVFYEPIDDAIVIYSVFHCSQNPEKWRKRLGHDD